MFNGRRILNVITVVGAFASWVHADSLINNAAFSTLPSQGLNFSSPMGDYSVGAIPYWSESGTGGMGQWAPFGEFNSLPDGSIIAFSDGGIISQDVGPVVANTTYTVSVMIGVRLDQPVTDDGSAALLINGVRYYATGVTPTAGNWSKYTVTYTALPDDIGHIIALQLIGSGLNGAQGDFADVQVDATPEPSSLLLVGLCSILIMARRLISDLKSRT